jgi:predicted ATP-binding protein involved in virulence
MSEGREEENTSADPAVTLQGIRLLEFAVEGLFGEFNYRIPLNTQRHVTAIIAPNGTGKTLCLRMIHGLFADKWNLFSDTTYDRIRFTFSKDITLVIQKKLHQKTETEDARSDAFQLDLFRANEQVVTWTPRLNARPIPFERYLPFISRVGTARWRHDGTGRLYSAAEIVEEFGDALPEKVLSNLFSEKPPFLQQLTTALDCRLIEAQRLLILQDEHERLYRPSSGTGPRLAIAQKAEFLKSVISREINSYATLSQSLDRSFPRRVLSISRSISLPQQDLRSQLDELDRQRRALMEAGILDTEVDEQVPLPSGELSPEVTSLLNLYAGDIRQKLASLSPLLAKINRFKDLINERFRTKQVRISRHCGFEVFFHDDVVPLEKLSSGEQHQLVLFFELLFEIKSNSLILIDEPELSLHVAWQKKFISDLIKIIELNRFDVLLATHSPQLIARWNDVVVELGDVYEGDQKDQAERLG